MKLSLFRGSIKVYCLANQVGPKSLGSKLYDQAKVINVTQWSYKVKLIIMRHRP